MPTATDYSQAIQSLRVTVHDEELKAGEVAVDSMGLPLQYAGNFAVVFQVRCPQTQKSWAVKCFTKEVDRRGERYEAISQHLQQVKLPFMVGFEYQERGILVSGRWHPIVKMDWVEGEALNRFVAANLDKPGTLRQLLGLWRKLAERLREAEVTHADLQHGNVLLVPAKDREGHRLMLVDYDGMYVPALADRPSGELGHPAYQHPQRLREGTYSAAVDRFSHLAIYSAIHCLSVEKRELWTAEKRELWTRFDNGDNLLFREADFRSPGKSELFQELWALGDPDAQALIGRLILATQTPLEGVPLLREVVSEGTVPRLSPDEEQHVKALMDRRRPEVRAVPPVHRDNIISSWLKETEGETSARSRPSLGEDTGPAKAKEETEEEEGETYGLAEEPKAAAPPPPQAGPSNCPSCGSALVDNAVLCVLCGYDLRTGQKLETQQTSLPAAGPQVTLKSRDWKGEAEQEEKGKKRKGRRSRGGELPQSIAFLRGCAVAFACSMLGVFIWWLVAYFTEMESGYIALVLGGLTGMGMMIGYGHEDALPGIASAVIAFVAIIIAKVVVFFSIIISIAAGVAPDMAEMGEEEFAAEQWEEEGFADWEFLEEGMPGEAEQFAAEDFPAGEFPDADVDVGGAAVALGALAFFWLMFGFWDILFILIACGMAYKVGSGTQWWED